MRSLAMTGIPAWESAFPEQTTTICVAPRNAGKAKRVRVRTDAWENTHAASKVEISQLTPGMHRLDLTARNLGAERYNAEVRLWVGDPNAPTWKTVFTYRSSGRPGDTGGGHTVRLDVAAVPP